MKISTLFIALLIGMTAMTACQNDAPQQAAPTTGETTQPAPAPQDQMVPQDPMAAPTISPSAAPTTGSAQPQIMPPSQAAPRTAAPPTGTVAAGMNPAHGQPGHRCDIAVGAPLNSKPAPKPQ